MTPFEIYGKLDGDQHPTEIHMDEMGFRVIKKLNNQDDFEDYQAKEATKEKKEQADEKQMSNKAKCSKWLFGCTYEPFITEKGNQNKKGESSHRFMPDDEPVYEPLFEEEPIYKPLPQEEPVYKPLPQEEPTYEPFSEEELIRNRLRKYKCFHLTKELIGELQNLFRETFLEPDESGETYEVGPTKEKGSGSAGWLKD
ncbi:hypothetical protein RJT34_20429 [Clitoria ternatea]|uniref:Uncharacterized protein n=1 Tax=Clitoria ternatea TaxID=43366 RepID=A0AAN9P5S0_CLITE